jgi:hypothetical protein
VCNTAEDCHFIGIAAVYKVKLHFFSIKGTSEQVMTGVPEFKIANCFVAKLVNIPDIHCVSRLAFDDFNSPNPLAQTCSEVPKLYLSTTI